jgi:HAD superfamily hydrolase (TIGR01549 family)
MSVLGNRSPIRAILCDVDGTLYHQGLLRALMVCELCTVPMTRRSWGGAQLTWRSLRFFRRIREELRSVEGAPTALQELQYHAAAQQGGVTHTAIEQAVNEWIYQRPLKYLKLCRRRGLEAFMTFLESRGLPLGVFSDYPVTDKLQSLGMADKVSVALCATDPEINAFKPCPKGFLYACALWGLSPEQVLYVGDRPEVDAAGAARAGMPCVILARQAPRRASHPEAHSYVTLPSFAGLQHALTTCC